MPPLFDGVYCRNCRKPLDSAVRFCPFCGREQGAAQPVDPPPTSPPSSSATPPLPTFTPETSIGRARDGSRVVRYGGCLAGFLGGTALGIAATLLVLGLIVVFAIRGCVSSIHNEADRAMHGIIGK